MKRASVIIGMLIGLMGICHADPTNRVFNSYYMTPLNDTLAIDTTFQIDTDANGIGRLSAQYVASTVTIPPFVFYDGRQSTMSITITDNSALSSATARTTITRPRPSLKPSPGR